MGDPFTYKNNEYDYLINNAVFNKMSRLYENNTRIYLLKIYKRLLSKLHDIFDEKVRFKPLSSSDKCCFVGDEHISSWLYIQDYAPMPRVYTKLYDKVTIVNPQDEIPDIIQLLAWEIKATKMCIATGYMFDSGINMIGSACMTVAKRANQTGRIELIIGSLQAYKPGVKQNKVNRNTADIINALCKLPYFTIMTYPKAFYHGKYYYISNGEITYIITGSSNVTSTAYRSNMELDVLFRFDDNEDPLLVEFIKWYDGLKADTTVISELDLDSFESNLYKDDSGNKHGSSYYRSLTSEEEKERYRFLDGLNPTRIETSLFAKRRDYKAFLNYAAFIFEEVDITVLECFSYGNASYVLSTSDNTELQKHLCRKSKDQVQKDDLFITSIPHDELYEETVRSILEK